MPVRQPAYLLHQRSGRARVRINGKDHYLGPYDSPESRDKYDDLIAQWRVSKAVPSNYTLTIDDLCLAYLEHAQEHYTKDGQQTSEVCCIRNSLRFLIAECGRIRAREFGPRLLKAVRQKMVDARLTRSTINNNVGRIRRMFRWAVGEELLPSSVLVALSAVQGLQAGRSNAKEGRKVGIVSQAAIDAIKPYVSKPVWAMVQLQLLTGMRSGEVLAMRGCDLNTSAPSGLIGRAVTKRNTTANPAQSILAPKPKPW